jgi:hypothetical protein
MSWQMALLLGALAYAVLCALFCIKRHRRNRRINLPPPSVACRRNGPECL